jgi:hypothetical protein
VSHPGRPSHRSSDSPPTVTALENPGNPGNAEIPENPEKPESFEIPEILEP